MAGSTAVEVGGRSLTLSNLDKVLYPSGFTKAQVIDYYARVAPFALPHLANRALTFKRFPNGTDTNSNTLNFLQGIPTPGAINDVPEPATLGIAAIAAMLVARRRR